jgi:SAM-dependent methyltransferase
MASEVELEAVPVMPDMLSENEAIYDRIWARLPIPAHTDWPIWAELQKELTPTARLLELGSGVLPRIPVSGSYFVDLSQSALRKLSAHGGHSIRSAGALPFCDGAFRIVCAFEVLEHIPEDEAVMAELARVIEPGGALFFSVPVSPELFTGFDDACGHIRRYEADKLRDQLVQHGLFIEQWTTQPNNFSPLVGNFVGSVLRAIAPFPRVTIWLKQRALAGEMKLRYHWRQDDIRHSHIDGGLIAIARKR